MPRISKHGGKEAMHSSHVTISIALLKITSELMAGRTDVFHTNCDIPSKGEIVRYEMKYEKKSADNEKLHIREAGDNVGLRVVARSLRATHHLG
jgi:hypothetical protein